MKKGKNKSNSTKIQSKTSNRQAYTKQNQPIALPKSSKVYHPTNVVPMLSSKPLKNCPFDKTPLQFVNNSITRNKGWCCLTCRTLFFFNKSHISTKQAEISTQKSKNKRQTNNNFPLHFTSPDEIFPKSTILRVKLKLPYTDANGCIAIVSKSEDQRTRDGIYWIGRMLPSLIMISIQTNQSSFSYNNIIYNIEDYKLYSNSQKYLNIVSRFYNHDSPKSIYVFAHKDIHRFSTDNYESVTAMVPCANVSFPVPITVYYEKSTQLYFINEEIYSRARREYGLPYLKLHTASFDECASGKSFSALKMQSELRLLGYSVSASDGLTISARRDLLKEAMDSGILTKSEIMNHLEWLIHSRSKMSNMDNAIAEWKADLLFVSEYRAFEQRTIWVKNFMSRFSNQQTHEAKNK